MDPIDTVIRANRVRHRAARSGQARPISLSAESNCENSGSRPHIRNSQLTFWRSNGAAIIRRWHSGVAISMCMSSASPLTIVMAGGVDDQNVSGSEHLPSAAAVRQKACLLYTSDAADEEDSVDLGGSRII